jgi:hypothetical protein
MQAYVTRPVYKGIAGTVFAGVLDRYWTGEQNLNSNAMFAASTGVGLWAASMVASPVGAMAAGMVPAMPGSGLDVPVLATRLAEVGGGLGVSWAINKYGFGNDFSQGRPSDLTRRLAITAIADVASEYLTDYMYGDDLAYFSGPVNH